MRQTTSWRHYRLVPESVLPRDWHSWVLDRGSLTKRLIRVSHGDFHVNICHQSWEYPKPNEALALQLGGRRKALVREVELVCGGEVWVKARSVIPGATLSGVETQLKNLGTKPLGAFLFRSRSMRRKAIELARFSAQDGDDFFGRRSIFLLHDKPLLVSEVFMPVVLTISKDDQ